MSANTPQPPYPEPHDGPHADPEARLTALLLGELSEHEAATLREAMAKDPALAGLYEQLEKTIGLVREAVGSPEDTEIHADAPLKLAGERREKLLESFKVIPSQRLTKARRWNVPWRECASVAALFVALCLLAGVVFWRSGFEPAKSRAQRISSWEEARVQPGELGGEPASPAQERGRESGRFRWYMRSSAERPSSQPEPELKGIADVNRGKPADEDTKSSLFVATTAPVTSPLPPAAAALAPPPPQVDPASGLPALTPAGPARGSIVLAENFYNAPDNAKPVAAGGAQAARPSSIILPAHPEPVSAETRPAIESLLAINGQISGAKPGEQSAQAMSGNSPTLEPETLRKREAERITAAVDYARVEAVRDLTRSDVAATVTPPIAAGEEAERSGRIVLKSAAPPKPTIALPAQTELSQGVGAAAEAKRDQSGAQADPNLTSSLAGGAAGAKSKQTGKAIDELAAIPAPAAPPNLPAPSQLAGKAIVPTAPALEERSREVEDRFREASRLGEAARRQALFDAEKAWETPAQPSQNGGLGGGGRVKDSGPAPMLSFGINPAAPQPGAPARAAKPEAPATTPLAAVELGFLSPSQSLPADKPVAAPTGTTALPALTEQPKAGQRVEFSFDDAVTGVPLKATPTVREADEVRVLGFAADSGRDKTSSFFKGAAPVVDLNRFGGLEDAGLFLSKGLATPAPAPAEPAPAADPAWRGVLDAPQVAQKNEVLGRAREEDSKRQPFIGRFADTNRAVAFGDFAGGLQAPDQGGPLRPVKPGAYFEAETDAFHLGTLVVPQDKKQAEAARSSGSDRGREEVLVAQSSSSVDGRAKLLEDSKRLNIALNATDERLDDLSLFGAKLKEAKDSASEVAPKISNLKSQISDQPAAQDVQLKSALGIEAWVESEKELSAVTGPTTSFSGRLEQLVSRAASSPTDGEPTTQLARLSDAKKRALKEELKEQEPAPKAPATPPAAPIPQPEIQTSDNAFSTFSLNVSDVSFKLAAAALEKGTMPDPSTVRSEEFINAFDYRDPEPGAGVPIAFAWERARYPFAHNRDLLRFSIKTAASGRQPGRPLNLVLLLDNSGSMERADRVLIIRECLRVLATQLRPEDRVSVVAFARTPRLWIDGLSGQQASELVTRVGGLTPQGGTNLEDAMNLAYQTALRHYSATGVNRVVLLTDGAANLGDVQPESLKRKVEAHRKQGVALDCFGIGWEGYNDDLLESLSRNGDGRYGFVNSPEAAASEFAGQLAGALRVAASDVKVQVQFNPQRVTLHRQIGYARHQLKKEQFRDNTVDAAEIGAAEAGNALYVAQVHAQGEGPIATVRVRYKVPGTSSYHEHEWIVPFNGAATGLEQSSAALRLAGAASAFSEWLVSSPFAAEVTPDRLLGLLGGVSDTYGADARPKRLEWMVRQAKAAGK